MELNRLTARRRLSRASPGRRSKRSGQLGFTLIEVVVSVAILATIAGSIGAAFAIGFRTLGNGEAQAKLVGDNDVIALEQQIGADVNRAVCLADPNDGQTSIPSPNGCLNSINKSGGSTCGASYVLCLAWYAPGSSCHTVTYVQQVGSGNIVRIDSAPGSTTNTTRVGTGGLSISVSWTPASTTTASYFWTKQVALKVTQKNPVAVSPVTVKNFALTPLAADPMSAALGGTNPC
jgi:prepilin-type N-terminal cleavage/methylation domain-containing protein